MMPINGADALRWSRKLAQKEEIFTGISGGATLAGALQVSAIAPKGSIALQVQTRDRLKGQRSGGRSH